jgi:hypothetical protein
MPLEFKPASRKAVPMIGCVSSVSGGGKTYTSLLLAAGIAGPSGKVGFIDTENGRGEMYADSPGIMAALPNGYLYLRFDPPFSPARYIEHLKAAEDAGITVCIVDSGSHEWEGIGGVDEMANSEANKKKGNFGRWAIPKSEHKKFVYHLLSSPMHVIVCLRAREKTKQFKRGEVMSLSAGNVDAAQVADKDCVVSVGLQSVCEKNFQYEATWAVQLDEYSHNAVPVKVPEPLLGMFPKGGRTLTKADGEAIRKWNETGSAMAEHEQLQKRARMAAEEGLAVYQEFFKGISAAQRKALEGVHAGLKATAEAVDRERAAGTAGEVIA